MQADRNSRKSASPFSRQRMEHATRLHWFHWLVVIGSLVITFVAWQVSKTHVEERVAKQFERESSQTIANIQERMIKYEDALWAGVALLETMDGEIDHQMWRKYASSISIEEKYPGINGIGYIEHIDADEIDSYNAKQHEHRESFQVYPEHDREVSYPIVYIEPVEINQAAVGLDMAHENNRFFAAEKARTTGTAQITGPIVLVQDSNQTPGFLFFAPFYQHEDCDGSGTHESCLKGLVYAPFVMKNLMLGTLAQNNRHHLIRLSDGGEVLYTELETQSEFTDPDPLHTMETSLDLYGRSWNIEIHADTSFRAAQKSSQPKMILAGGIFIDSMIFLLFVLLARANQQAISFADHTSQELELKNAELEQYVYTASHDLKSPLFSIQGFASMLTDSVDNKSYEKLPLYAERINFGIDRMRNTIDSLLEASKVGLTNPTLKPVSLREKIQSCVDAMIGLEILPESCVLIFGDATVLVDDERFEQVVENLISNAAKYADPEHPLKINIRIQQRDKYNAQVRFEDNGIGISEEYREKVFDLFQRLSSDNRGNGVGLAIVKRIIESFDGNVWIEDSPLGGTAVCMSLPRASEKSLKSAA